MTEEGIHLTAHAADFAARRHVEQRRKGAAREPYINHLAEVAALLADATEGKDAILVAAGYLHDTLEDTETSYEELATLFGPDVATVVAEVTDDMTLPQAERKRRQVETAGAKSERARLLKIADKTSNLRALIASPPADWDLQRVAEYPDWAEQVVDRCRGLNRKLERVFDAALAEVRAVIAARAA
jgi:guanosine-3',5'-bis(diphosphate) 3'-pyrophosphohydrolase